MNTTEIKSTYSVSIEIEDHNGEAVILTTRDFKSKNKAKKCYDFIDSLSLDIDGIHLGKKSFKVTKSCYYDEMDEDNEVDIIDLEEVEDVIISDTEEEDYEDGVMYNDISGMTVKPYGRGYHLYPKDNDNRVGTKYFMGCFWQPKNNAWFFKKEHLDYILSCGAILDDECITSDEEDEVVVEEEVSFNDMKVYTYGKGLILIPKKSSKYYGTKYFQGGFWTPNANGWFFKKDFLDILTKYGATFINKHIKSKSEIKMDEGKKEHTLKWEKYGRGFLLVPSENHPDKGIKYYYGGWWMPKKDAWFFREKTTDIKL